MVKPATDDYFGRSIVDPYRWMEAPDSQELRAWLLAQDAYTRDILKRLPNSDPLEARVQELSSATRVISDAHVTAHSIFFLDRAPGRQKATLQVQDSPGSARLNRPGFSGNSFS